MHISSPYRKSAENLIADLNTSLESGLSTLEVKKRLRNYGLNRLQESKQKSAWIVLLDQFKSLIVLLLIAAALLAFIFQDWMEGIAIVVVIVVNAAIGFFTEIKAVRSMEALRNLVRTTAKVRRNGKIEEVPAEELVPGDIVILEGGDLVPADLRLIEASKLQADESSLTGESVPVNKQPEPLPDDVPLAERSNMVFMGTAITRGACEGVVTGTGTNTELGQISSLVEEAEKGSTPLEKKLDLLGQKLVWVTLAIAAVVAAIGIIRGKELFLMAETAIALAVAAIPEGLPIVATIALARGMLRMARRNALVNRLSAVETLGSTNVICTDKTGTLTENKMTVTRIATHTTDVKVNGENYGKNFTDISNGQIMDPLQDSVLRRALEVGVFCNNASLTDETEDGAIGDPMEVALLAVGKKAGIRRSDLLEAAPEEREVAFDTSVNMMATFHKEDGKYRVAVKGAPDSVLDISSTLLSSDGELEMSQKLYNTWLEQNEQFASDGFRIIALATKTVDDIEVNPYQNLTFLGLVCLLDPPRHDVRNAIVSCKDAGVRVIMVTGDHPSTARNVALEVGLLDDSEAEVIHGKELNSPDQLSGCELQKILNAPILARVNPKQKLDLISIHQKNGSIVAMTGDGVNDAPALKKADIGIAMGKRGTQVAREASDMVLRDDEFSTIVTAVEEGRTIFGNIRKFISYLLSCNISEIMVVTLASLAALPLPILPLQILFLNLVTDVFPALALGMGEANPQVMKSPPRDPNEPLVTSRNWWEILGYGTIITVSVLGALVLALDWLEMDEKRAVTISFLTLAFIQLWHVFNMRDIGSSFLKNQITLNPYVWGAIFLCVILLLAAVYLPIFSEVLKVVHPGKEGWAIVIILSSIPWLLGQGLKAFRRSTKADISVEPSF